MKRLLPILLLSALLLTGCHNGDSSSAEDNSTESTTTTAAISNSISEQTEKNTGNNESPTAQTTTTAKTTETTADLSAKAEKATTTTKSVNKQGDDTVTTKANSSAEPVTTTTTKARQDGSKPATTTTKPVQQTTTQAVQNTTSDTTDSDPPMTSADKRLISCNLTPDEIAIAVNDDNVKNIDYRKYDIRWRDHDDPLDYTVRPEEKIADALYDAMEKTTERINVIVWFKPINEDERAKKISEILSSNNEETIVYDEEGNIDIKATEFAKVDSWSAANIKAVNEIMEETAANFINALGIQDNDIISASKFARAMSCNLTQDMIIEASKIDNVSQITINDLKEAFDSIQPATTDATTDNSSSVPVSDLKTPFACPSNIMGDLNESWTITLADALALLQFIDNEEKYPFTEQQQKNADCYNPGDGITAMDAKAIISVVTNEVVCLPVIEK